MQSTTSRQQTIRRLPVCLLAIIIFAFAAHAQTAQPTVASPNDLQNLGDNWSSWGRDSTIYFGTGQNYSNPASSRSDSLIALNINTGAERWVKQLKPNDT